MAFKSDSAEPSRSPICSPTLSPKLSKYAIVVYVVSEVFKIHVCNGKVVLNGLDCGGDSTERLDVVNGRLFWRSLVILQFTAVGCEIHDEDWVLVVR